MYDEGYPFGYPNSYDAEDWREPCWTCHVYVYNNGKRVDTSIVPWLKNNCTGFYDYEWRFNSGNPYIFVRISKDEDATAFLLTFKETA